MREAISVVFVAILGFLLGVLVIKYLSVHPTQMSLCLLAACVFFCHRRHRRLRDGRRTARWIAVGAALATFLAGYAREARQVLSREDDRLGLAINLDELERNEMSD